MGPTERQEPEGEMAVSNSSRGRVIASKIKALRLDIPGVQGDFSLSYAPFAKSPEYQNVGSIP